MTSSDFDLATRIRISMDHMAPVISLQSSTHRDLLDTIDKLRSEGISHYVDLPQIVVCGEQSSGKSSVLGAISGLYFPAKETLCTLFATELILRRSPNEGISVSISPGSDRSKEEKARLRTFKLALSSSDIDIGEIIEKAKTAMGLGEDNNTFSTDILRIELSGPTQPHLTMVDLPGFFQAGNRAQSDKDAELVKTLAYSYMSRPRSIILAVVSAKNDFANQAVTKYARELDPHGMRTLGLITKPDTLDKGSDSEKAYLELAQNNDVKFRLGWAVLRNRDFNSRNSTNIERDKAEAEFFSTGVWTSVDPTQLGVAALRPRLSQVLRDQILFQLPNVIADVENGLAECRTKLAKLGAPRQTVAQQRQYLASISLNFTLLLAAALDGIYEDPFFGNIHSSADCQRRLRAVVQNSLADFSEDMRVKGHAKEIVETASPDHPQQISRSAFTADVKELIRKSRGRELPGTFNPLIIGELFTAQCKPWRPLIEERAESIFKIVSRTIDTMLEYISNTQNAEKIRRKIVDPVMYQQRHELKRKVDQILEPHYHGHPITYNHYLTETVQKVQEERRKIVLSRKIEELVNDRNHIVITAPSLLSVIMEATERDMDSYACSTAIDFMEAYYKVARKKVVDDFSVLVIEQSLKQKLPYIFSPEVVAGLDDEDVTSLATESDGSAEERTRCNNKLKVLQRGLEELNRLRLHRSDADPEIGEHEDLSPSAIEQTPIDSTFEMPAPPASDSWLGAELPMPVVTNPTDTSTSPGKQKKAKAKAMQYI